MLRHALRRLLWSVPTLLATSLVLFFVTTLAPDPAAGEPELANDPLAEQARRARFLDLPRFVNVSPADVRSRAAAAMAHVAAADSRRDAGSRELVRLGGAALPYVLPAFEALAPDARRRVATALVPLAERMHLAVAADLAAPEDAVLFWTRIWDDRALDFSRPAVERAVDRLVEHGSDARENDVAALDTLALPYVFRAMTAKVGLETLARLTRIAQHATARGPALSLDASRDQVARALGDWSEWWFAHTTDFVALDGVHRGVAVLTETRYGKWLKRIGSGELGVSLSDGEPIWSKLCRRAPTTLSLCALATLASWALAVPIGALGAWLRGRTFDVVSSALMFLLYAMPAFVVAELLHRAAPMVGGLGASLVLPVAALAAGSLATLSRWQRTAMLEVVGQEFVRTARAKGMPGWRVLVVHALRNALMPTVTVAGLHLPALFGADVIVEEVFGLPGVGFETMRAIESHDAPWLMAVLLAAAVLVTLGLVASDIAYGALDPRVRELFGARQRRSPP
jgi:ABC-type dipeptide/oligopeptide/nickel transport system permease component